MTTNQTTRYRIEHANTGARPNPDTDYGPPDLLQAAAEAIDRGTTPDWYWITIYDAEDRPEPEIATALVVNDRAGIAWGGDATWADLRDLSLDEAVDCWLNRPDEWEDR